MEEEKFLIFGNLLENEKVYMDPGLTFENICSWLGVEEEEFDAYLIGTIGYAGSDILKAYRDSTASCFMEKYGIKL